MMHNPPFLQQSLALAEVMRFSSVSDGASTEIGVSIEIGASTEKIVK